MYRILIILYCVSLGARAQSKKPNTKLFQLSLAPGISTNGLHAGGYTNVFSFNLSSGYSAANQFVEIGLLSNANENGTRGLQVSGLANVTGINAYKNLTDKEADQKYRSGFEANLTGAQLSGVVNYVLFNVYGWQATGGVNITREALLGFQLAGISNVVHKYSFGLQVAGVSNISVQSMDGVQLAAITNYTQGGLYGVQLSAFNEAGFIEGKNGYDNSDPTGLQVGLVNKARERMNGYQIGLVNIGGRMQGTQIGLVNIYKRGKEIGTRDGTSIGLVNIGEVAHAVVSANELFTFNYEIATGNRKNARMASDSKNKYVLNSLIYSHNGNWLENRNAEWALGYALRKYFYNRSALAGRAEYWFFSYGASFLQLNERQEKLTKELNLLVRPELSIGKRIHPKLFGVYMFAAASYNVLMNEQTRTELSRSNKTTHWPGVAVGVLMH
jgi:hypothetical protein